MDNLGWARELVDAPDLQAIGTVIDRRLQSYTAKGVPDTERALAERIAFEHQARHYMARANARGFALSQRFEWFATRWVNFVNQNKAGEENLGRLSRQQEYERGRTEATTAAAQGFTRRNAFQPEHGSHTGDDRGETCDSRRERKDAPIERKIE